MELVAVQTETREKEDPVLASLGASMHAQFGDRFTADEIAAAVAEVAPQFADARIRIYVPILLRKAVGRELARRETRRALAPVEEFPLAEPGAA